MERYKRTLVRLLILALAATGLSILAAANNPAAAQGSTGSPIVRVEVFARGDTGTEQLELRLAGRTVSTFTLTTDLREYSYETSSPIGARDLAVHYVNNAATANGNRAARSTVLSSTTFNFRPKPRRLNSLAPSERAPVVVSATIGRRRSSATASPGSTSGLRELPELRSLRAAPGPTSPSPRLATTAKSVVSRTAEWSGFRISMASVTSSSRTS